MKFVLAFVDALPVRPQPAVGVVQVSVPLPLLVSTVPAAPFAVGHVYETPLIDRSTVDGSVNRDVVSDITSVGVAPVPIFQRYVAVFGAWASNDEDVTPNPYKFDPSL
jgi:hypothetical protein